MKKIAFGCDHVGFILKHEMVAHLIKRNVEVIDRGTWPSKRINYPHHASQVALVIVGGEVDDRILICGTGVGTSTAANRFAGIRAIVCSEPYSTQLSRQHNDTNILASGSRVVGLELTKMIADTQLGTQYGGGRHQQCVEAITAIEQRRNWDSSTTCMDE